MQKVARAVPVAQVASAKKYHTSAQWQVHTYTPTHTHDAWRQNDSSDAFWSKFQCALETNTCKYGAQSNHESWPFLCRATYVSV